MGEDRPHERPPLGGIVLDERDGTGQGAGIAREHAFGESRHHASSWRAMTSRWISLVPSPIVISFTSRKNFSAG